MHTTRQRLAALVIAIAAFGVGWFAHTPGAQSPTTAPVAQQGAQAGAASLSIDYGNGTVQTFGDIPLAATGTLFDLLKKTADAHGIALSYKDYGGGLGVFLQSIGGKEGTKNAWWQYWVNGTYSQVGVSSYTPKPGDRIEFKLTSGQD